MYTIYLPVVGEITLRLSTMCFDGFKIYIAGADSDHNPITVLLDKIVFPVNKLEDVGYCHILSYTTCGKTVLCNYYRSIH